VTDDEETMSLLEHLEELRRRLIIIVVAVVLAAAIGFIVSGPVQDFLKQPLPEPYRKLYFLSIGGAFAVRLKIAFFVGIALAMPVILFQVWRFVTPGLTRRERRLVWPLLLAAMVLFAIGMSVGYLIIPFAIAFLLSFTEPGSVEPLLTLNEYIGFITTVMLAFGLMMEFPIVLIALSRVGILSYRWLAARRRFVILGIVVFAVVVTPGGDPFSPSILAAVMYVLFELSLQVIRLMNR
jgi:sec-independent protein translocase protein TatC